MRRLSPFLLLLLASLGIPVAHSEDRLGLQLVTDGAFTGAQLPAGSYESSDFRFNGQAVMLASFRLTSSLFAFYEGRISHLEGLNHHEPPLSRTTTLGV